MRLDREGCVLYVFAPKFGASVRDGSTGFSLAIAVTASAVRGTGIRETTPRDVVPNSAAGTTPLW